MGSLYLASFAEIAGYIGYVVVAVLVLLLMITVHEAGHFFAGKIFGFGIEEFAIGFGPKIYRKKTKSGEYFSVRALPLGGFCSFKGEDEEAAAPDSFNSKPPWQRIIVLISGAFMNYVLAVVLIITMFGIYGQTALIAVDLVPTTEYSQENLLQSKDVLLKANGKNIYITTDLYNALNGKEKGELVEFTVRRKGEDVKVLIAMRENADFENIEDMKTLYDVLGFAYSLDENNNITEGGLYATSVRFGFFQTIGKSFEYSFKLAGTVFTVIGQLLTGRLSIGSVGGTITTIGVTANAIKTGGMRYLLNIAGFIGVNLAVFNLLPVPALDGARVIFCLIEWIFKKPVNRKVEAVIHTTGFVLILLFAVLVDLQRCF